MDEPTLLAIHAEVAAKRGLDVAQQVVMILLERQPDDPWHYARSIAEGEALKMLYPSQQRQKDGKRRWVQREVQAQVDGPVESCMPNLVHVSIDEPERVKSVLNGQRRMAECHPQLPHWGHGFCRRCWEQRRREAL